MEAVPEGKLRCSFLLRKEVVQKLKTASAMYPELNINACIELAGLLIIDAMERDRLAELLDDYNKYSAKARKLRIPIFDPQEIKFCMKDK